ncbi:MAG: hypothetical protein HZB55_23730 [Deltaproteobacteria bacterium]|nr:hypothetical protein [Deltaproteobacteria bacterium]
MKRPHTYRASAEGGTITRPLSLREAIVVHCVECFGFEASQSTVCSSPFCGLYAYSPYGLGHRGGVLRVLGRGRKVEGTQAEGVPEGQDSTPDTRGDL